MKTLTYPPSPPTAGSISLEGYNADKANAMYYGIVMPAYLANYIVGNYYLMERPDQPHLKHIAQLVEISHFDFFKLTDSAAYLCEGVNRITLRHILINKYGPGIEHVQLSLCVFQNWDKATYYNFVVKPRLQGK